MHSVNPKLIYFFTEALSYQLQFTIIEGAPYTNELNDKSSEEYMTLQQNVEDDVSTCSKTSFKAYSASL